MKIDTTKPLPDLRGELVRITNTGIAGTVIGLDERRTKLMEQPVYEIGLSWDEPTRFVLIENFELIETR